MSHVEIGLNRTGGYRRPRRSTSGVARAQTSQERNMAMNTRTPEWGIPSARISTTFWIALNRAKPAQINAIHSQRTCFGTDGSVFIFRSYSRFFPGGTNLPGIGCTVQ